MAIHKKYDTYKECTINTPSDAFFQIFTSDWSFSEIRSWMLDTYCIDESSIVDIKFSSVTIYKNSK